MLTEGEYNFNVDEDNDDDDDEDVDKNDGEDTVLLTARPSKML